MSNKFTRNITKIDDVNEQGLETNNQNDLLSHKTGEVFLRTLEEYHQLTDNVKDINGVVTTMHDGNKVFLPLYLGSNYEVDNKRTVLRFFGDTRLYKVTLDSQIKKGEYNPQTNITTYDVLDSEIKNDKKAYVTVDYEYGRMTTIGLPHKSSTDYDENNEESPRYLRGRTNLNNFINETGTSAVASSKTYTDKAIKTALDNYKPDIPDIPELPDYFVNPVVANVDFYYDYVSNVNCLSICLYESDTYKIVIKERFNVIEEQTVAFGNVDDDLIVQKVVPVKTSLNQKTTYHVEIRDMQNRLVYLKFFNVLPN